jgi:hypothetical protein
MNGPDRSHNSVSRIVSRHPARQGSVYLYVLGASMLVAIIGLAALAGVRIQTRSVQWAKDDADARNAAVSAVELGLLYVQVDPNWRTTYSSGAWLSDQQLGDATFTLEGVDPQDGDLGDSEYEPLILTGTGAKGIARHKTQVTLVPVIQPLEALNTCLHASGKVKIHAGKSLTVVGAPVSTNGVLDNDELIDGDAHAASVETVGTITGTLTVPAPSKDMPDPNVISDYIARATAIPFSGTIDKQVLTPTSNPWGAGDPNGVYFIDTGGVALKIMNSRIHGTLIVKLNGNTLTLDDAVFMQNYRSDYPTLIVDGHAYIKIHSADETLSEADCGVNFNPVGAPYESQWDEDTLDEYPNELRGLIHINGNLWLGQTARVTGTIICAGTVHAESHNTIVHDPGLYTSPPEGYTYIERMKISPGSWKQVVD